MKKAILFPLAWNESISAEPIKRMHECEAMIAPHVGYISIYGAVYFDVNWPIGEMRHLKLPINGYIHIGKSVPDAPDDLKGKIGYKVKIEKILTTEELKRAKKEHQYVPFWRRQCLYGEWPEESPLKGKEHETSKYWFKLSEMVQLPRGIPPEQIVGNRPLIRGWIIDEIKIERHLHVF